ncbi:hypothetical protein Q1695_007237 [Nippostrongylus brasiliensis]|nr:hypothetical protein Q1695_007237 [Nippostrongylus brasiliensis]
MSNGFGCPPPKKRARQETMNTSDDYPDSDDSFNDPVLPEPSQLTQAILQRRAEATLVSGPSQASTMAAKPMPIHISPIRAPSEGEGRKQLLQRSSASVTPRRFNTQEKNDYHHNGQLLMLKNRLENMERERERIAAATRDQLIAKEKHHAAELNEKEQRIRQLESQVQSLRQENLQGSFQVHNVTMSQSVDVEMSAGAAQTAPLPTKRVSLPKNSAGWKNISRFGAAASVFANNSTAERFGNENVSDTFAHIPSQMFVDTPVFRCPQPVVPILPSSKLSVPTASKQCQANHIADDWNVHSQMREAHLESLLSSVSITGKCSFDLTALDRLCQVPDHQLLRSCLPTEDLGDDDSFS